MFERSFALWFVGAGALAREKPAPKMKMGTPVLSSAWPTPVPPIFLAC